jgi:hypothetical protein
MFGGATVPFLSLYFLRLCCCSVSLVAWKERGVLFVGIVSVAFHVSSDTICCFVQCVAPHYTC